MSAFLSADHRSSFTACQPAGGAASSCMKTAAARWLPTADLETTEGPAFRLSAETAIVESIATCRRWRISRR